MELYPKKLHNINDLERERIRLLKQVKKIEDKDYNLPGNLFGKKNGGNKKEQAISSKLLDMLPISNPIVKILADIVLQRISKPKKVKAVQVDAYYQHQSGVKVKSKIKALAIEFIGGYLKWKAIELTYKGARRLINARRNRFEREELI
jgi:hypothetical protein